MGNVNGGSGGNPWHDAEGKFCSRGELQDKIADALKREDFITYAKERKNYEEIENTLPTTRSGALKSKPVTVGPISGNDTWDNYIAERDDKDALPSNSFLLGHDFEAFGIANTLDTTDIEAIYRNYAAGATRRGIDDYEAEYDFRRVDMDDAGLSVYNTTETYRYDIDLRKSSLIAIKQNAAREHMEWRTATAQKLSGSETDERRRRLLDSMILEVQTRRVATRDNFTAQQFNYLYHAEGINEENWEYSSKEMANTAINMQRMHDTYMYGLLKEKELKEIAV